MLRISLIELARYGFAGLLIAIVWNIFTSRDANIPIDGALERTSGDGWVVTRRPDGVVAEIQYFKHGSANGPRITFRGGADEPPVLDRVEVYRDGEPTKRCDCGDAATTTTSSDDARPQISG